MTLEKALAKLSKAVTGSDSKQVNNKEKLLADIYKGIVGADSRSRNNATKIISDLADNWSSGGGGGGDVSLATVTFNMTNYEDGYTGSAAQIPIVMENSGTKYIKVAYPTLESETVSYDVPTLGGGLFMSVTDVTSVTGNATTLGGTILVTGDCTINYEGSGGGEN